MAEASDEVRQLVTERVALARRLLDSTGEDFDQVIAEWSALDPQTRQDVYFLARYEAEYREARKNARSGPQRRAMKLLRSFLNPEQLKQLKRSGNSTFLVQGNEGHTYKLCVRTGNVVRVEKHGKHWEWQYRYCIHDDAKLAPDGKRMPPGDLSLQHMLMLMTDESGFVATANVTPRDNMRRTAEWREIATAQAKRHRAEAEARLTDLRPQILDLNDEEEEVAA